MIKKEELIDNKRYRVYYFTDYTGFCGWSTETGETIKEMLEDVSTDVYDIIEINEVVTE